MTDSTNHSSSESDEALMQQAAKGHREAFAALVQRHQRPLVNFFRRMGVHMDEEDLAQETLVKVFKYRKRYRPTAKFTTFLYFVGRRIYVDYVRKQDRIRRGAEELKAAAEVDQPGPDSARDEKARAVEALQTLSEEMRSVVVLNVYQGMKYHEIATSLGIPLGTVKTRMFHALRKLREVMNHDNA